MIKVITYEFYMNKIKAAFYEEAFIFYLINYFTNLTTVFMSKKGVDKQDYVC